jgi:ABC-type Fe3+ transport system substrate-binding protein
VVNLAHFGGISLGTAVIAYNQDKFKTRETGLPKDWADLGVRVAGTVSLLRSSHEK